MICVDFGSGHNPRKGFIPCDVTGNTELYYDDDQNEIVGLESKVDIFYLRNVVHHLPSIEYVILCLKKYLKPNGKIVVIEPTKEAYKANIFLDILWYRGITQRKDIRIYEYREYEQKFLKYFNRKKKIIDGCKEITIYKNKGE